jgi:histidinol dehydrogenase
MPSKEVLWTLNLLGISKIYCIGGAQAIFALGYGIGEIPKVDKIFGPGNQFVDEAKRVVSRDVAIDMPAGPSEVFVISDGKNTDDIIHDLLAQLEHGGESRAWFFCTDANAVFDVENKITKVAQGSSRWNVLEKSLKNLVIKTVKSIEVAIGESNKIAPEHLILNVDDASKYVNLITNAGSVFLGRNTPESLGDYISGTNHVLPTSGFARAFSGLSVLSFGKFTTFQTATFDDLCSISKNIQIMAEAEGLEFHAKSAKRLNF